MKPLKIKLARSGTVEGNLRPGTARVIGKRPKYIPYVSIDDGAGCFLVSLDEVEMAALIRRWNKANGL